MYSLLLIIIYIAFISLGLPDSLIGSAWPVMQTDINVPVSYVGIVTIIISGGTIVSSLMSGKVTDRFGTGAVTAVSVCMTAAALLGFSISNSFAALCLWAVPYGLGAGGVDAALNNYVALHYKSRHMSWLHCSWGVGAAVSPYIMSFCLSGGLGWHNGFLSVSVVQFALTAILFLSLPLWRGKAVELKTQSEETRAVSLGSIFKIKGVKPVLTAFFCYCALETTAGFWASSYLVQSRGVDTDTAAMFASLFYIGITAGRFICGFISEKLGDKRLIRYGIAIILCGAAMVLIPFKSGTTALCGLVIIGLGCAPVYPSVIHSTPFSFGIENSQAIIGVEMACAYIGNTFMPPLFGLIAENASIGYYPLFLLLSAAVMLAMTETANNRLAR